MGNPPADEEVSECVGELLDQGLDLTARFLSDRADLSASAAFALNRVCREGPIRLTALAAKEGVSQPSMTQLIQRLERLGLVARLADPGDGRAALIGITGRGQALLDDRKRMRRERLRALMATLTPEEESALWLSARVALPVLRRLVENADCPLENVRGRPGRSAEGVRMRGISVGRGVGMLGRGLKKVWIPLVLIVVLAVSGLVVSRLHRVFASQDLNANAGKGIEIVQFNPKILVYDVDGSPGTTGQISYFDPDANVHLVTVPLPWSITLSTTLPTVSASLMAQTDGDQISCKVTVNGTVREEQSANGVNAQTYCLVKSA